MDEDLNETTWESAKLENGNVESRDPKRWTDVERNRETTVLQSVGWQTRRVVKIVGKAVPEVVPQ